MGTSLSDVLFSFEKHFYYFQHTMIFYAFVFFNQSILPRKK